MRWMDIIGVNEAFQSKVTPERGLTIWFNPDSGDYLQSNNESHATFPFSRPEFFGMSEEEVSDLWDHHEDDVYGFLEDLIQKTKLVRVNLGFPTWKGRPGVQAASVRLAQKAANWLADNGLVTDYLAVEVMSSRINAYLRDAERVARFLKFGR